MNNKLLIHLFDYNMHLVCFVYITSKSLIFFLIYTNQMFDVCDVKCSLHHLKCVKMFLDLLLELNLNISCVVLL